MNQPRSYVDYLEDILDAAEKVGQFITVMTYEDFRGDDKTKYAVVRALEVIGEATKHIPESVRVRYPELPWRSMAGMRDKLIHDYTGVNWEVVWKTAKEDVPSLKQGTKKILDDATSQEGN